MGSVEKAARQLFAAQKADGRIPKGHPQREDLEKKQQTYGRISIQPSSRCSIKSSFLSIALARNPNSLISHWT